MLLGSCGEGGQVGATQSARDRTGPIVAITSDKTVLRAEDEIPVFFDWSEPVQGFSVGNVTVQGGHLEKFAQLSERRYSANFVSETSVPSPLTVSVPGGGVADLAGNMSTQSATKEFTVDETPPLAYALSNVRLSYSPFSSNSYYSPGVGTVNTMYSLFTAPIMYGSDFPTEFIVLSQYSNSLSKFDKSGRVVWNYMSSGRFATSNGTYIFTTNGIDLDTVPRIWIELSH